MTARYTFNYFNFFSNCLFQSQGISCANFEKIIEISGHVVTLLNFGKLDDCFEEPWDPGGVAQCNLHECADVEAERTGVQDGNLSLDDTARLQAFQAVMDR